MHEEIVFILKEEKGKSCSLVTSLDLGLDMFKTVLTSFSSAALVKPAVTTLYRNCEESEVGDWQPGPPLQHGAGPPP